MALLSKIDELLIKNHQDLNIDDEQEKWYFSIVDVVEVLTESVYHTDYIKKIKKRDPMLAQGWGQIVTPLLVKTAGGRQKMNFADTQGIFRLIQSIPSPKAEPLRLRRGCTICYTHGYNLQNMELPHEQRV